MRRFIAGLIIVLGLISGGAIISEAEEVFKIDDFLLDASATDGILTESDSDESKDEKEPNPTYLRLATLMSMEAEIEELDPFFGIGIYTRELVKNDAIKILGFDYLRGSGKQEVSYGGVTLKEEFVDHLYMLNFSYGYLTESSKGKSLKDGLAYFIIGGGLIYERAYVEVEILGETIESDLTGFGFLLNAGMGFSSETVDFLALYVMIPGSDNVTGALYLSLGTKF